MDLGPALRALDNPHRRRIMSALRDPRRHFPPFDDLDQLDDGVCVTQVSQLLGVTLSTASTYLAQLRDADLITADRVGKHTLYRRSAGTVEQLSAEILDQL